MTTTQVINPFLLPLGKSREELWKRKFGEHIAEGVDSLVEISQGLSNINSYATSADDLLKHAIELHGLLNSLHINTLTGIWTFLTTLNPQLPYFRPEPSILNPIPSSRFNYEHRDLSYSLQKQIEAVIDMRNEVAALINRFPPDAVMGGWPAKEMARCMTSSVTAMKHVELVVLQIVDLRLPELQKLFVEGK